jgi:hypothetical protein
MDVIKLLFLVTSINYKLELNDKAIIFRILIFSV